jgi:hypothetical protein
MFVSYGGSVFARRAVDWFVPRPPTEVLDTLRASTVAQAFPPGMGRPTLWSDRPLRGQVRADGFEVAINAYRVQRLHSVFSAQVAPAPGGCRVTGQIGLSPGMNAALLSQFNRSMDRHVPRTGS